MSAMCKKLLFVAVLLVLVDLYTPVHAFQSHALDMTLDHLFHKAYDYQKKGDCTNAIKYYSQGLELEPRSRPAYEHRADCYYELHQYELAIADYSKAIELTRKPDLLLGIAYNNRGYAYKELGKYDSAIADFTSAIRTDPKCANFYLGRAITYSERGDYAHAIADYDKVIELSPRYTLAYLKRGKVYESQGMLDKAKSDYAYACRYGDKSACEALKKLNESR
jgi:tetratricopeptide (TPR) repeat protein